MFTNASAQEALLPTGQFVIMFTFPSLIYCLLTGFGISKAEAESPAENGMTPLQNSPRWRTEGNIFFLYVIKSKKKWGYGHEKAGDWIRGTIWSKR